MFNFNDKSQTKKFTAGTNSKKYIILHHTGGGSYKSNMDYLANSSAQVSCHFVVGPNGEAGKIGDPDQILWHAGNSKWGSDKMLNSSSLGIEIVGPGFTDVQRDKVISLVQHLMAVYNVPAKNVLRHKDISTTGKVDVDDSFWNTRFKTFQDFQNSLTPHAA